MGIKKLFEPISVGKMDVKNRILMSPMGVNFGVEDGHATPRLSAYFSARARGGAGMMLVGGGATDKIGSIAPDIISCWDDKFIPTLSEFTQAVHGSGDVKFGMQLLHGGRQADMDIKVAPSPIPSLAVVKGTPRELTLDEIRELAPMGFGEGARRCKEAGFDFVEIHGAHGYLVSEFLSPISNKRTDAYGGGFENRIRFIVECLRAVKEKVGKDFPVGVRMNGNDFVKDGFQPEEARRLAPILEENGADYLHVSFGIYGADRMTIPSMYEEEGCFVYLAEGIKKTVSIPVITVGAIKSPIMAENILRENRADIISMGRALLSDPELPNKAREGRINDIRPCMGCCQGCAEAVLKKSGEMTCVVNPDVGREWVIRAGSAEDPKKIMVIGSGPAGLEVARLAAGRGHHVTVCEKEGKIGGQLVLAAIPPMRRNFVKLINYYSRELNKLNVEIRLNCEADESIIDEIKPDEVVVATGSLPRIPEILGLFDSSMEVVLASDILYGNEIPGDSVLIIGGQRNALLTADFLSEQGKNVAIVSNDKHVAADMAANDRWPLITRLRKAKVRVLRNTGIKEINGKTVTVVAKGEEIELADYDQIVIADSMRADRDIVNVLKRKDLPYHVIGDSKDPRTCLEAIAEGNELGHSL